jgi:EAL domain-containing protein (putative c-di-GMP-specific phosphodiesterase class I)
MISGLGYSSLGHLNTVPIDAIEIDRGCVAKLTDQPGNRDMVSAIIGLAHRLGACVIAEGVETTEQRDIVTDIGSDLCQGFHFGKPMSADLLEPLIRMQANGGTTHLPVLA